MLDTVPAAGMATKNTMRGGIKMSPSWRSSRIDIARKKSHRGRLNIAALLRCCCDIWGDLESRFLDPSHLVAIFHHATMT